LYEWPSVLLPVVVGGEPLANALLAACSVALVVLLQSWRIERARRAATVRLAVVLGAWFGTSVLGAACLPAIDAAATPVRVAAIEPGFHWMQEWLAVAADRRAARSRELVHERMLAPTRALWSQPSPPAVVLWPESSLHDTMARADVVRGDVRMLPGVLPPMPAACRLVVCAHVDEGGPPTPAALLLGAEGRVLAHQEKRRLVPGGEFQPFFGLLPASWSAGLRAWFEERLLTLPMATPGRELPPLTDAAGVPFGALLCYDNAFPEPAAAQVAAGARWLCVLSNEAWYEGGGELQQLMAMTVVRALETGTPIVRCTLDGWTGWVDARGQLRDRLPIRVSPQPSARILHIEVPPGPGRLPPLAWLRAAVGPLSGIATGGLLLLGLWRWATLRAARTASRTGASPGLDQGTPGSGS
jgi:apolipoprotein N-acyltransferase